MRIFFAVVLVVVSMCGEAMSALPPYIRNPLTTNQITIGASMSIAGDVLEAVGGGPSTNTLEYTQAISGTNFIIDVRALGSTNTVRIVLPGHSGLIWTNVPPNKERLVLKVWNSAAGFSMLITNGADNTRFTGPQTGLTRSTNGGWLDTFVFYSDNTNMVLGGQNWGARP